MKQSHDKYYRHVMPLISRYFVCILVFTIFNQSSFAYTYTWTGGSIFSSNWSDFANWSHTGGPPTPSSGDNLVFSGNTQLSPNNDYMAGTSFASITFSSGAGAFTLSGNAFTLTGGASAITASNATNTMTINNNITFSTAAPTITTVSGGTLTLSGTVANGGLLITNASPGTTNISGVISGTGGFTKTGAGTATLSAANTYTGITTISAGTLVLQDQYATSWFAIASGTILELNRASDLDYTTNTTFAGGGTLKKTGSGKIEWGSAVATFKLGSGSLIDVEAGTFKGGSWYNEVWTNNLSGLTVASGAYFNGVEANVNVDALTGSGTIESGFNYSGYLYFTFGVNNGSGTFSGVLVDNIDTPPSFTGNFVKAGSGTQTLSGANTYTGTTTVSAGVLKIQGVAFSTTARPYLITSGTVLNIDGNTGVATGTSSISGKGTLRITGSGSTFANNVGSGRNITMAMGSGGLIDVQLGATFQNGGWQNIDWSSNLATLNVAGTFDIWDGNDVYVDALTGAGTVTKGIVNGSTHNLIVGVNNGSGTFTGTILAGSGPIALTKTGSGTETLSGNNTYTGTTTVVTAGTLKLGSTTALGAVATGTYLSPWSTLDLNGQNYTGTEPLASSSYSYYKNIVIDYTKLSGTTAFTNFPVLVSLTDANLISAANGGHVQNANGYDIMFTSSDGSTQYSHQIEKYTATTGQLIAWVKIPSLSTTANTTIRMYYGNQYITSNPSSAATWSSDYMSVYHFNNSVNDGSSNGRNCTDFSTSDTIAKIGSGRNLNNSTNFSSSDATGKHLQLPNGIFNGVSNFTFSGWVYMNRDATSWERIFDFGVDNTNSYFFLCPSIDVNSPSSTNARITTGSTGAEQGPSVANASANTGSWIYWTVVLDHTAQTMKVYRNGSLYGSATGVTLSPNSLGATTTNYFGRSQWGDDYIDAKFDEFRLLSATRSADWILSEYNNQNSPSTFYSVGTETATASATFSASIINSNATAATFAGAISLGISLTTTANNQITLTGTISPSSQNLTTAGTNSVIFTSNTISVNNLTISAGTLNGGSSTINVNGNFTNSGTFVPNTNGVNMVGGSSQSIPAASFNNLTINNSAGATLGGNISVGGTLTLTSGILNTGAYTVDLGTTGSIVETSPSATAPTSYVTGAVKATRNIGSGVGNVTFGGLGVELTETNKASQSTIVIRTTGTGCTANGKTGIKRYFTITPQTSDAGLSGTMVFHYFDAELNSNTEANLKLYKSADSRVTWSKQTATSLDVTNNVLTLTGITSFSDWTASDYVNDPLPIELMSFTATKYSEKVNLAWITATETNNDYFTLERSNDGNDWEEIYTCPGARTSTQEHRYSFIDYNPSIGINYYRLKQTDINGAFTFSNIESVKFTNDSISMQIFPTPAIADEIIIMIKSFRSSNATIKIFDSYGRQLCKGEVELSCNPLYIKLTDICLVNSGIYFVTMTCGDLVLRKEIVVGK